MRTFYTDTYGRIMALDSTERTDLIAVQIDDTAEHDYPFSGWSDARILCYRIEATDGRITMMTPYVPTHMMSAIETLDAKNVQLEAQNETLVGTVDSLLLDLIPSLLMMEI